MFDAPHRLHNIGRINDVVPVEHRACLVPAYRHGHLLIDARLY